MNLLSFALVLHLFPAKAPATDPLPINRSEGLNKTLLLQLVNDARSKGCNCGDKWYGSAPPIVWNDVLEKAANNHSTDMSKNGFFSHTSPTAGKAGARLQGLGYNWKTYGENIAMGYDGERDVITGWLHSPGHCSNIMNPEYKEMGVAKVGNVWTQEFGTR